MLSTRIRKLEIVDKIILCGHKEKKSTMSEQELCCESCPPDCECDPGCKCDPCPCVAGVADVAGVAGVEMDEKESSSPSNSSSSDSEDKSSTPSTPEVPNSPTEPISPQEEKAGPLLMESGFFEFAVDTRSRCQKAKDNLVLVGVLAAPLVPWVCVLVNRAVQGVDTWWNITFS